MPWLWHGLAKPQIALVVAALAHPSAVAQVGAGPAAPFEAPAVAIADVVERGLAGRAPVAWQAEALACTKDTLMAHSAVLADRAG